MQKLWSRLLGVFTRVHDEEIGSTLLLTLGIFVILTAYYIIKPVREALILSTGGAELKSYTAALQVVVLSFVVPLYGRLANKAVRKRLISLVTLIFVACLVLFYLLAKFNLPYLGIVFYVWTGIFNVMIVAQFWAFANDIYSPEEGKRLFVIIAFGQNVGAVLGSVITKQLIGPLGVYQLLLLAALILALSLLVIGFIDLRGKGGEAGRLRAEMLSKEVVGGRSALALLLQSRYLLLLCLLGLLVNVVNTNGEYILGRLVVSAADGAIASGALAAVDKGKFIGGFYADFFAVVNVITMLIQLLLVSRIFKYLGVRCAVMILPLIAFAGYLSVIFIPILGVIRWVKSAENATDYSLQNTLRHALFLPMQRDEKYKGKQLTDVFAWRIGDLASGAIVFVGVELLALQTKHFAMVNALLVTLWLVIAILVGREFSRRSRLVAEAETP